MGVSAWGWLGWAASAWAAPPESSDVMSTSVGVIANHAGAINQNDVDVHLAERFRLTLAERDAFKLRALGDARFRLDTDEGDTFEWSQVRQLGFQLRKPSWTLDLGRHPVYRGGPRVVDGAQLLVHPTREIDLGVWGGLAPDLFTTLPRVRPGAGPILSYAKPTLQASIVGEALLYEGEVDRIATLAMARGTLYRLFELSGRADIELAGANGPHISDLYALAIANPTDALRFDVFYNGFSSYRYQLTELLDPKVQRYSERIVQLGIDLAITQDQLDPTLHHMLGGGARLQPKSDGAAPRVQLDLRQRFNDNELNRFTRVQTAVGIADVAVAGRLLVMADTNFIFADGRLQSNPGAYAIWEPGDEGWFALDVSGRALINPVYEGLGWYADAFVDAFTATGLSFNVGLSAISEPDPALEVPDMGLTGYARVNYTWRPGR